MILKFIFFFGYDFRKAGRRNFGRRAEEVIGVRRWQNNPGYNWRFTSKR